MTATPTPADHAAAKRAVDLAQLDAAPWQLEHLAVAIAEARTPNTVAARGRCGDVLDLGWLESRPLVCVLPAGHDGWHREGETDWTHDADATRVAQ